MAYAALRQITVQYQMQLSDENTSIHSNTDRVTFFSIYITQVIVYCLSMLPSVLFEKLTATSCFILRVRATFRHSTTVT